MKPNGSPGPGERRFDRCDVPRGTSSPEGSPGFPARPGASGTYVAGRIAGITGPHLLAQAGVVPNLHARSPATPKPQGSDRGRRAAETFRFRRGPADRSRPGARRPAPGPLAISAVTDGRAKLRAVTRSKASRYGPGSWAQTSARPSSTSTRSSSPTRSTQLRATRRTAGPLTRSARRGLGPAGGQNQSRHTATGPEVGEARARSACRTGSAVGEPERVAEMVVGGIPRAEEPAPGLRGR